VIRATHNTPNLIADDDQQTLFYDPLVSGKTKINSTKAIPVLMAVCADAGHHKASPDYRSIIQSSNLSGTCLWSRYIWICKCLRL